MTDSENGPDGVNNRRTQADSDTNVTHACSGFDLEDTRRTLIAKREVDGADTPAGHTYSNIVEILDGWLDYERPAWATYECQTLAWAMNYQIKRLERRVVGEA